MSVAVLSAKESKQLFGVNLALNDIQPVWIRVENDVAFDRLYRDIGVRLTLKTWPPVTHKIDPDIDDAMNALIEDLLF